MTIKQHLTAITGGIGAGKSFVSNILRQLGYNVYDCDSRAKIIIDSDLQLRLDIADAISHDVLFEDNSLNRPALANIVFKDRLKLNALNKLVHGAVRRDIIHWCDNNQSSQRLFIETAILYESHLDKLVNDVWCVCAPEEIRIERVMARNNFTAEQVRQRIEAQNFTPENPHPNTFTIINDGKSELLLQINTLLAL
jgi:dephospho-CoA kinase